MRSLRKRLDATLAFSDFTHLKRHERLGRLCTLVGYGTGWIFPNPLSAFLISHGIMVRWYLGHQLNHRGYDRVPGLPARYQSERFAKGRRRWIDWFDWMLPDAWELEHRYMHHLYTSEKADPDLIQRNLSGIRHLRAPTWLKTVLVGLNVLTWKWSYYAPQTLMFLQNARMGDPSFRGFRRLFNPFSKRGRDFWLTCLLPNIVFRFVLIPSAFLAISARAAIYTLITAVMAELFTNLESFILIGPNHAGYDLYSFDEKPRDAAEFVIRQVLATSNYQTGSDVTAFFLGYMNYHIEHHIWPDLPLSKYREAHHELRELCRAHGIPYVQENVLTRLRKTIDIMTGKTSMRRLARIEVIGEAPAQTTPELVSP